MNIGHLYVLFGLNVQSQSFRHGLSLLASVHMAAASAIGGVASLAHGIINLTEEAAKEATHVRSLSQAMGLTIEQTQKWSYVAEQSGSNMKELSVGFSMLLGNLHKVAEGRASKALQADFAKLGITAKDAKAAMAGPDGFEGVLLKLSDRFKKMGPEGETAALATSVLGRRAGRAALADMIQGADVIKAKFQHLQDIGGVIDAKKVLDLQGINAAFIDIHKAWKGLTGTVIGSLAPVITKLLNDMALWIGQNKAVIGDVLGILVKHLIMGFRILTGIMDGISWMVKGMMEGKAGPVALFSALAAGVLLLAALLWTALLPVIGTIGAAIWAAMLPLLPFAALFALIIFLGLMIHKHWHSYKEFFVLVWAAIGAAAHAFWDWLGDKAHAVGNALSNVAKTIRDKWHSAWASIHDFVTDILAKITRAGVKAINFLIHGWNKLSFIPGFHSFGDIDVPEWAKTAAMKANAPKSNTANVPGGGGSSGARQGNNVNVAPTTINIYGVKGAVEAGGLIQTAIDTQNRNAAAALGGEIS